MKIFKNQDEKQSIQIVEELAELAGGHEARLEEWERLNQPCFDIAKELSLCQVAGSPASKVNELRRSLQRAQWDRDRIIKSADIRRADLQGELATLTSWAVENAIQEIEGIGEIAKRKHVRSIETKKEDPFTDKKSLVTLSNDRAFSQINKKIVEGRNRLRDMKERASIPMIREFLKKTLGEVSSISMDPEEIEINSAFYSPLEEKSLPAPLKETYMAMKQGEFDQLERRVKTTLKSGNLGRY